MKILGSIQTKLNCENKIKLHNFLLLCLIFLRENPNLNPICDFSYLLPEKGRGSKQKTSVARRTVNPAWNHTFVYEDVSLQELATRSLELTVWDHDRLASNEFLGGLRFNLGSGETSF